MSIGAWFFILCVVAPILGGVAAHFTREVER